MHPPPNVDFHMDLLSFRRRIFGSQGGVDMVLFFQGEVEDIILFHSVHCWKNEGVF